MNLAATLLPSYDHEMDAVRWFPIARAIDVAAHASERKLVRQARTMLGEGAGRTRPPKRSSRPCSARNR